MKKLLLISTAVFYLQIGNSQTNLEYLGQTPPGNTAELFAPGIISLDNRNESMITFSPNGMECYFTEHHPSWDSCKIHTTFCSNRVWSTPEKAAFSNNYSMCPSVSSDGKQLFFASDRDGGIYVYQCSRTADGNWAVPVRTNSEISSSKLEFSCHPSNRGTMYVCSWRPGGVGGCDGWRIPFVDGQYKKAENLGALNSKVGDCVWAPGPNEEYLIFQSNRHPVGKDTTRTGGFFETDLFITFAMSEGKWSVPQNLGPMINSSETDGFAWVTHDGKYMFFSSNRRGTFDIYWVSLDSIVKNTPRIPFTAANQSPDNYCLYQDNSNILDGTTTIEYVLNKPGYAILTIYTLANEKIGTILNEYKPEGKHQFNWNDKNLPKGEYLCELQVIETEFGNPFQKSTIQVLLR